MELPKHGEVWTKLPCSKPWHRMGWSLGAGTHVIDKNTNFAWGTEEQIRCGCLVKGEHNAFDAELLKRILS